jgi:hypothetical protein
MDQNAKHNAHCVYVTPALVCGASVHYHLVWIPRYRKKILVEPIATRLKQLFRDAKRRHSTVLKSWLTKRFACPITSAYVSLLHPSLRLLKACAGSKVLHRGGLPRNFNKSVALTGDPMLHCEQRVTWLAQQDL